MTLSNQSASSQTIAAEIASLYFASDGSGRHAQNLSGVANGEFVFSSLVHVSSSELSATKEQASARFLLELAKLALVLNVVLESEDSS